MFLVKVVVEITESVSQSVSQSQEPCHKIFMGNDFACARLPEVS
jgi:hypothetical protein